MDQSPTKGKSLLRRESKMVQGKWIGKGIGMELLGRRVIQSNHSGSDGLLRLSTDAAVSIASDLEVLIGGCTYSTLRVVLVPGLVATVAVARDLPSSKPSW